MSATMPPILPSEVTVLVRDWLSANHVLLRGDDGNVLVDTGYGRHAPFTLALLRSGRALGNASLSRIVNTHCHSDHMGGNAMLARAYGCSIAVPEGEAPLVEHWDEEALLLTYADQVAERFGVDEVLRAGETHRWGNLDWEMIAAPGHDMRALCFFNAAHGILISGDALWSNGFGFVMPPLIDPDALPATRATLETLAKLPIRIVIPGHGEPFTDIDPALERAFRRLLAFESDPARLASHALKVVLTFKLLDCRALPVDGLADYLQRVPLFRDFNARFFGLPAGDLAAWLTADLERIGAARRQNGFLVPAAAPRG